MSSQTTTTCDFCGKVKGETNRWWVTGIATRNDSLFIAHGQSDVIWTDCRELKDCCGEQCVQKAVSRWLSSGKLDE